jgi:DNA-binding response OmpR family regulator
MPKILIIEDDKFSREMMARKVVAAGFEVSQAADGEQGMELIKKEKPDLILLDLVLPKLSGKDILSAIKQNKELNSIPVVVLSNLDQMEDKDEMLKSGVVDYIVKAHFTPTEIVERIKKFLK